MKRNGNGVGIDASFTLDPNNCGHDNVVERDGWKVCGAAGFLGIEMTCPDGSVRSYTYDEWREEPDDDEANEDQKTSVAFEETRAHYQTLANVLEWAQETHPEWGEAP